MMRLAKLRNSAGFTLLELLVSMTVLSLLATTILFGWRIAVSAWQKASTHLEQSRTVLETNQLLQEKMASMVSYQARDALGRQFLFFEGGAQTARFLSRYSLQGRASAGLYRIEYQVAEAPGGKKQLLMNEFPLLSEDELTALIRKPDPASVSKPPEFVPFERGPRTRVLMDGLQDCRFEYFKVSAGQEPASWVSDWANQTPELPRAMAIRIVEPASSADLQPVSIVAAIRNISSALPHNEE